MEELLMETRETVRLMTSRQTKEIAAKLVQAIPNLTYERAQYFIGKKGLISNHIQLLLSGEPQVIRTNLTSVASYDSPTNRTLSDYYYREDTVLPEHFAIRSIPGPAPIPPGARGIAKVHFAYVEFPSDPTPLDVQRVFQENNLELPDIAEVRSFHRDHPHERSEGTIISLVGDIPKPGEACRALCHFANAGGCDLGWYWTSYHWRPGSRFLAVTKRLRRW